MKDLRELEKKIEEQIYQKHRQQISKDFGIKLPTEKEKMNVSIIQLKILEQLAGFYLTRNKIWENKVIVFGLTGEEKDIPLFIGINPKQDVFKIETKLDSKKSIESLNDAIYQVIDPNKTYSELIKAELTNKLKKWEDDVASISLSDKSNEFFNEMNKSLKKNTLTSFITHSVNASRFDLEKGTSNN